MKRKYLAVVPLAIISLFNLPIGFSHGDIPAGLAWGITALGVAGWVSVVALVREQPWSIAAAEVVGGINLAAAIIALVAGQEGAAVGLVLSIAVVAAATALLLGDRRPSVGAAA